MEQKYTLDTLLDDIQNSLDEGGEDGIIKDKVERESRYKLIVVQMFLKLVQEYGGKEYADDEKLYRCIEAKLNGDDLLSGFLFFVSQNPQFDYSWNYLRKRKKGYIQYIVDTIRFLNNVVADINVLAKEAMTEKDIHVLIHELFDVALSDEEPYVKTTIRWESFQRIAMVNKEYSIRVNQRDNALATGNRKEAEDVKHLKEKALNRLANSLKDRKGAKL